MPCDYGIKITRDGHDHVVTVRDLPQVCTSGDSHEQAVELAADAVDAILCHLIDRGLELPEPSPLEEGEIMIVLPLQTSAKAELYRAWLASGISKTELARRLNVGETEVRRMLDPRHGTRLDAFDRAFRALGLQAGFVTKAA